MELRLRGSGCHAEHVGDLFMLVAFYVVQDEHPSRAWWKSCDRLFQVEEITGSQRRSDHSRVNVHATRFIVILFEPRPRPPIALSCVEHHVHRQPVQPGPERALSSKQVQFFPSANEDVLRQLFRAKPISRHSRAQGEDSIHMGAVESFERTTVSSRRSRDVSFTASRLARGCFDNGHSRHRSWNLHLCSY